jgi:hypothetical protein
MCSASTGDFEAAWTHASKVEGWLTRDQGRALFRAASSAPDAASIVELGSHHGRSTILLAVAKPPRAQCVAVDPFDDPRWGGGGGAQEIFLGNLQSAGVLEEVTPVRGTSQEAGRSWDQGPVGLLYADGAHGRADVLADIDLWRPHIADEGWMLFHDAFSSVGVTFALLERLLLDRSFRYMGSHGSLAGFRREKLSWPAALWNRVWLLARLPYFARNLLVKYGLRRKLAWLVRVLGHRGTQCPY